MFKNKFKRPLAAIVSLAMLVSGMTLPPLTAGAASDPGETVYHSDPLDTLEGLGNSKDCAAEIVSDGERSCLKVLTPSDDYKDADVINDATPSMTTQVKNVPNEVYIVEFDIKFTAANCGAVQLVRGLPKTDIGPTIYFDGSKIRTMTGSNKYVTMRSDAKAGEWYNVKVVFNGKSTCYSYVTNTTGDITTERSAGDIKRNLSKGSVGGVKIAAMSSKNPLYLDNLSVYKPSPDAFELTAADNQIPVPQEGSDSLSFTASNISYQGIDLSSFKPFDSGLLSFKLYNADNTADLSASIPKGVSLNAKTGELTVDASASPATYTVRLENYTGSFFQSVPLTISEPERVASLAWNEENLTKLPAPNAGSQKTLFQAVSYNQYGELYSFGDSYTWELLGEDGNPLELPGVAVDPQTGEVTVDSSAELTTLMVKATSVHNPELSITSDPIPMYRMVATTVEVGGGSYAKVEAEDATYSYTASQYDQEGIRMPAEEHTEWSVEHTDGVRIDGEGNLIVSPGAPDQLVSITATAASGVSGSKEVQVYSQVASSVEIGGNMAGVIPEEGSNSYQYSASTLDQYGFAFGNEQFSWELSADNSTGLSLTADGILTVSPDAEEEQTVNVVAVPATNPENRTEYPVVISKQIYTYLPVKGGFEITDGEARYSRPLYSSHVNDKSGRRYIGFVGDQPDFLMLLANKEKSFATYAHMFLGLNNGEQTKWLSDMDSITFRYLYGRAEYDITDASFEGTIRLTFVRTDSFDGFLIKAKLPDGMQDKLVMATAGDGGVSIAQQTGGNTSGYEFKPDNAKNTSVSIGEDNTFAISKSGQPTVSGGASVPLTYSVGDASKFNDLSALLGSEQSGTPMVIATTENNTENDVYLLLTTESVDNAGVQAYLTDAKPAFDHGREYLESVSKKVDVTTPDPYFDSMVAAQTVAMDAAWISPTVMHGPIAWFTAHGGWRSSYGQTTAGNTDRVSLNAQQYMKSQKADGRITAFPTSDKRYNMGEVLVDQYLYNWLWTGDLSEMENGGYSFVTRYLEFIETQMKVGDTNLYENWLNAWNTDNKWANGGASSIETAYVWRAYDTIADIAARLGKTEDAEKYQQKADAIKAEMKDQLWADETGVYGEYRDLFGLGRLHDAPDLSSIYTPIDVGMTDMFERYQMVHYADTSIPNLSYEFPRGGSFKEASNWLPSVYSSRGIYQGELINQVLAYCQSGQYETADTMMRGIENGLFQSKAAGPGLVSHITSAEGTNTGHLDFADVASMVVRTAVEGTFGIKMDVPNGAANITPGFPQAWDNASINTDYLGYTYEYADNTEKFHITTEQPLRYNLSFKARSADILSVQVNGTEVDYTLEAGVEHGYITLTTPSATSADIEVTYGDTAPAQAQAAETGAADSNYTVTLTDGEIAEVYDPQGVLADSKLDGASASFTLNDKQGHHTFFVLAKQGEFSIWLPVNLEISTAFELTGLTLSADATGAVNAQVALANHTETDRQVSSTVRIGNNSYTFTETIPAQGESSVHTIPLNDLTGIGDGDTLVTARLTGEYTGTVEGTATNWGLSKSTDRVSYGGNITKVDLSGSVNQDLRTLHSNKYTLTWDGRDDYTIPNFYWVSDTTRSVTQTGRAWWEDSSRGKNGVPASLNLPSGGGEYLTGAGVPFDIAGENGKNAAFVSLYNNFPDSLTIPVNATGQKLYFLAAVSTNHMQSHIENARITVNLKDGTQQTLSLSNPENIDDWLSYQTKKPYAQSGYIQNLGSNAHANLLSLDLGSNKEIESVELTCTSNEVLAGLLGITVLSGSEAPEPADKTILEKVIQKATELRAGEEFAQVIESVQKSFDAALDYAKYILGDDAAGQDEVDGAWIALMTEIHKLGFVRGDASSLQLLYDYASGLNLELFLDNDAKAALPEALAAAKQALDNKGDLLAAEIDAAVNDLLQVVEQLRYKPDKSILSAALQRASAIDTTLYTPASIERLNAAATSAQAVHDDPLADQQAVDAAADNLNKALDDLVKTPEAARTGAQGSTSNSAGTPATGETLPLAAGAAVMLAASAAVLVIKRKKR